MSGKIEKKVLTVGLPIELYEAFKKACDGNYITMTAQVKKWIIEEIL
jgi:hypothetical protein